MKKSVLLIIILFFGILPLQVFAQGSPKHENIMYLYGGTAETYKKQLASTRNQVGTLAPGYFDIDSNGNLVDLVDPSFVRFAHQNGYKVTPFVSNHWDQALGVKAMKNRKALAKQIATAVEKHNLDGVNIDIENLTEKERDAQTEFLKLLSKQLHPRGKTISLAIAPVNYDAKKGWWASYDLEEIGKTVDTVFIMAYEQHYVGGEPGPQAGYEWMKNSVHYIMGKIPKKKLVLGVAFYGRYWTKDIKGEAITFAQAQQLLKENGAHFKWSAKYQSTYATFTDQKTDKKHELWIDNAQSLKKKISIAEEYGLKGWGGWKLGNEDPELWDLLSGKTSNSVGQQIADQAQKHVGNKITIYDSADLVSFIYGQQGIQLPSQLPELVKQGKTIYNKQRLRPGDLVFFGTSRNHLLATGIYVGDGKFIIQYKPFGTVKKLTLHSGEAKKYYLGAKRIVN